MTSLTILTLLVALLFVAVVIVFIYVYTRDTSSSTSTQRFARRVGLPNGTVEEPSLFFGDNPFVGISSNDGSISISTPGSL